jgi:hypothetical protein
MEYIDKLTGKILTSDLGINTSKFTGSRTESAGNSTESTGNSTESTGNSTDHIRDISLVYRGRGDGRSRSGNRDRFCKGNKSRESNGGQGDDTGEHGS